MRQRVGYNFNGSEMRDTIDRAILHCKLINAPFHVVMNDQGIAERFQREVPNTTIIYRGNYPDGNVWDSRSDNYINPEKLASSWKQRNPNLVWYAPNEPAANAEDMPRLMAWLVRLMKACIAEGVRAVVWNAATAKEVQQSLADAGVYDEFLRTADVFTNGGHGWVGYHDYSFGIAPVANGDPWNMVNNFAALQPSVWPVLDNFRLNPWSNWLVMRWLGLEDRCRKIGCKMHRIIITEGKDDRMQNLEANGVIPALDAKYGNGNKFRGPLSQRWLLPVWYPYQSKEKSQVQQLDWINRQYPEYVDGYTLFTWSYNQAWSDYNYAEWPEFQVEMQNYVMTMNAPTEPTYIEVPVRITARQDPVNLRDAANLSGKIVGKVPKNGTYLDAIELIGAENYDTGFRCFKINGVKQYAFALYINVVNK